MKRHATPAVLAWLGCLLLAACGSGPVARRVSEPAVNIQQLTVRADGGWSVDLRIDNFSNVPMRFDGVSLAMTVEATHYHQQSGWFPSRRRIRRCSGAPGSGDDKVTAAEYLEALDQRKNFVEQLRNVMEGADIDALIVATTPISAPLIGEESTRVAEVASHAGIIVGVETGLPMRLRPSPCHAA